MLQQARRLERLSSSSSRSPAELPGRGLEDEQGLGDDHAAPPSSPGRHVRRGRRNTFLAQVYDEEGGGESAQARGPASPTLLSDSSQFPCKALEWASARLVSPVYGALIRHIIMGS